MVRLIFSGEAEILIFKIRNQDQDQENRVQTHGRGVILAVGNQSRKIRNRVRGVRKTIIKEEI
jgi:hypothetical protein